MEKTDICAKHHSEGVKDQWSLGGGVPIMAAEDFLEV